MLDRYISYKIPYMYSMSSILHRKTSPINGTCLLYGKITGKEKRKNKQPKTAKRK